MDQNIILSGLKGWKSGILRNPYFFKVIFCQGEKYPQVDVLFFKQREVFGKADLLQEIRQVLHNGQNLFTHLHGQKKKKKGQKKWRQS